MGSSGSPSNSYFLGRRWAHNPNGITISSAVFAQATTECPCAVQWTAPSPSKLPLPMGGCGSQSNAWFLGPTKILNPNGISIGSAIYAGLTSVTGRQTMLRSRYQWTASTYIVWAMHLIIISCANNCLLNFCSRLKTVIIHTSMFRLHDMRRNWLLLKLIMIHNFSLLLWWKDSMMHGIFLPEIFCHKTSIAF